MNYWIVKLNNMEISRYIHECLWMSFNFEDFNAIFAFIFTYEWIEWVALRRFCEGIENQISRNFRFRLLRHFWGFVGWWKKNFVGLKWFLLKLIFYFRNVIRKSIEKVNYGVNSNCFQIVNSHFEVFFIELSTFGFEIIFWSS